MRKFFGLTILFAVMLLGFQNCGYFSTGGAYVSFSSCGDTSDLVPIFENSFGKFFREQNCQSCHTTTGVMSSTPLADQSPAIAMRAFAGVTVERVEAKLQTGHQGYSWISMAQDFAAHKVQWLNVAGGGCASGPVSNIQNSNHFEEQSDEDQPAVSQNIQTLTWDLSQPPFNIAGAEFQIQLELNTNNEGLPIGYTLRTPSIKTGEKTLRIKDLKIYLNGNDHSVITWQRVNTLHFNQNSYEALEGTFVPAIYVKEPGEIYSNDDEWSIGFGILEEAN